MVRLFTLVCVGVALTLAVPCNVYAHPGHPGHLMDFQAGWQHPLMGLDHLLAMLCVGLLAVRCGGRGLWALPAAFIGCLLLGGLAMEAGLQIPVIEFGVTASVVVLGILVAMAGIAPPWMAGGLVMVFAICHGQLHAAEMLANGSSSSHTAGLLLSTAIPLCSGIAAAMAAQRLHRPQAVRLAGAAIAVAGLLLSMGAI